MPVVIWGRHAPTPWNRAGRLQGRIDIEADDEAIVAAMTPLVHRLRGVSEVWSSPLARARRSAAFLAELLGVTHRVDALLSELSFGPFEGRRMTELDEDHRIRLLEWMRNPFAIVPPWPEAEMPAMDGLEAFLSEISTPVAVIGHTVQSRWLEHVCGRMGVAFKRIEAPKAAADVAHLL